MTVESKREIYQNAKLFEIGSILRYSEENKIPVECFANINPFLKREFKMRNFDDGVDGALLNSKETILIQVKHYHDKLHRNTLAGFLANILKFKRQNIPVKSVLIVSDTTELRCIEDMKLYIDEIVFYDFDETIKYIKPK